MENFIMYNPVKLRFGTDAMDSLAQEVKALGKKGMLVYGKGSIHKSGLYQRIKTLLNGVELVEYQGIKPNPLVDDVNQAAQLARKEKVDFILAVGGGSVIDSAKVISVAMHYDGDAWDIMKRKHNPTQATPLLAVLTLAATGTEMNPFAVLQNHDTQEKIGWGCPLTYPKVSFLDPSLTTTVSADYTAYGIVDMIAHSLEAYFGYGDSPLSDAFAITNIREIMDAGSLLMQDLENVELRARILYAGTMALNGLLTHGKSSADWGVHSLGHILSLEYDVAHGASLSIAYPAWLKAKSTQLTEKISKLGEGLFGTRDVAMTIHQLEAFFLSIGSPITCEDADISPDAKDRILELFHKNKVGGVVHSITDKEKKEILALIFASH
jgi:alcohol dehydrogenase YqhD (iron-dependent ADH family)